MLKLQLSNYSSYPVYSRSATIWFVPVGNSSMLYSVYALVQQWESEHVRNIELIIVEE